jgi:hypothetical protein
MIDYHAFKFFNRQKVDNFTLESDTFTHIFILFTQGVASRASGKLESKADVSIVGSQVWSGSGQEL